MYQQLGLGDLRPTQMTIQLADRSVKRPKGEIHDVLIRVREFIYPVDFVVLETQPVSNTNHRAQTPIILGRPFLATANAIINCRNGSMRITFGDMTREVNVFSMDRQPRRIKDQTFEVNFVRNNCEEKSKDESQFCDSLEVKNPIIRVPFQKGKIDLDIFTFSEPTVNVSHEVIIQKPPIDISFEDLFADEIMCLDEPTRGRLTNCTSLKENVDLSFEELYEDELEFLNIGNKEIQSKKSGDEEIFSEHCGEMRMNNNEQLKLKMPKDQKIIEFVSQLCPRKQTHWNDGKRARGKRPKDSLGNGHTCTYSL